MLALLAFPIIQDKFHILKPLPLGGAVEEPVFKKLTWQGWWSGSYQDTMAAYLKGKTKLKPDLTRFINQIDFSLFDKMRTNGIVRGSDGYLFEDWYIRCYCGEIKMSYNECAVRLYKLKQLEDTLSRLGISVVTLQAGSKASYYPEYFPANERCDQKPFNDHMLFNRVADSLGIQYIDFNKWFVSLKGKTQGHLFTRQGVHWSIYGSVIAADSFVRYLQNKDSFNLPDMKWDMGMPHLKPTQTDADIFDALNLMMRPAADTFYYPRIWYEGEGRVRPKMIFIGDSYMWSWVWQYIPNNISSDWEFWYYNASVWGVSTAGNIESKNVTIENYDWTEHMLQSKCIVLMVSESNLSGLGWGFIEKSHAHFYGS